MPGVDLEGTRRTFPKLSYYVDAVMKMEMGGGKHAAIVEDEQRMVFVKTPDGLTKVIFSSGATMPREVETEDENDAMPASLVRKSTVIDERTNQQQQHHHQSDIPIAHPVKGTYPPTPLRPLLVTSKLVRIFRNNLFSRGEAPGEDGNDFSFASDSSWA